MTPSQGIAVGVRVFAVWLLLEGMGTGYFAVVELGMSITTDRLFVGLALTAVWMLAALALWRFPQVVARGLLTHDVHDPEDSHEICAETWLAVGCALIGVWVIVSSLPPLIQDITDTWPAIHLAGTGIYFLVRIALGVWLILGARGLRNIFRWTQYAGIRRSKEVGRA